MQIQFDSQYQGNTCHKLNLDQYYTPEDLAIECTQKAVEILGIENISEFYEPSAGTGAFVKAVKKLFPELYVYAADLEPKAEGIIEEDFLEKDLRYKQNRCFLGNPPFGARLTVAQKFWKKCIYAGDSIAWILPISQLDNNASMYEFDLIYSQDLGDVTFSGCKPVHCCFNIYKRPSCGMNPKPVNDLKSVSFMRSDSAGYKDFDYDFRMNCWGGRAGQLLSDDEPDLAMVYKIKVNDPNLKDKVKEILEKTDWTKARPSVSCKKVQKTVIVKVLKQNGIN